MDGAEYIGVRNIRLCRGQHNISDKEAVSIFQATKCSISFLETVVERPEVTTENEVSRSRE